MKINTNILEIKNLKIGYNESDVLAKDINLNLKKGELTALIGLNGIGKSTLLKSLIRLILPLDGKIFINQKDVFSISANKLARMCSFVSTENIRVNEMTVYALVALGRYPFTGWNGALDKNDRQLVEKSLHLVGIENLRNRKISNLSDGERQRASIARALAQDTPLIILDEPTAFLDIKNRYEIIHLLQNLTIAKEKAILFSSHDLGNVLQVADKLWIMHNSSIVEGAPEDMVLKGLIQLVFSSDELGFDPETGIFSRKRNNAKTIQIRGEGKSFFWTKKALDRIGIEVSNETSEVKIEISVQGGKDLWVLTENREITEFTNIYDLLSQIKRINL